MVKRILLCKGQGVYNASNYFIDELASFFEKEGVDVDVFECESVLDRDNLQQYNLIFSFNNIMLPEIAKLVAGTNTLLWGFLLDHPVHLHERLLQVNEQYIVSCVDRNHVEYIKRYYKNVEKILYLPLAGMRAKGKDAEVTAYEKRKYDVVMMGSFVDIEAIERDLSFLPDLIRPIIDCVIEQFMHGTKQTLEDCIRLELKKYGDVLADEEFSAFFSEIRTVDQYIQMRMREKVVNQLVKANVYINLFGRNWNYCRIEKPEYVTMHGPVDYLDSLEIFASSKIVLNIPPLFQAGVHDRVFSTIKNGAVSITLRNLCQEEIFRGNPLVLYYEMEHLEKLPGLIEELLECPDNMQETSKTVMESLVSTYEWSDRGRCILDYVNSILRKKESSTSMQQDIQKANEFLYELKKEYVPRGYEFYIPFQKASRSAGGAWCIGKQTILLLSHQMSRTGAPVALFTMAKVLKKEYNVVFASVEDGDLKDDLLQEDIPVVVMSGYWNRRVIFKSFARKFDKVIVNTVLNFPAIMILDGMDLPVYWWIHEHENYFSYGRGEIPNIAQLDDNIHVWAVGEYVKRVIQKEFSYDAEILYAGILNESDNCDVGKKDIGYPLHFVVVGTYGLEKGQDVLVRAYEILPEEVRKQVRITFIGSEEHKDDSIYGMVKQLHRKYPNFIQMKTPINHSELMQLFSTATGVILPSRREVMSLVVLENMMIGNCVVVSTGSGNADIIRNKKNGYVFENENATDLANVILEIVREKECLYEVGKNAIKTFEQTFAMDVFEKELFNKIK